MRASSRRRQRAVTSEERQESRSPGNAAPGRARQSVTLAPKGLLTGTCPACRTARGISGLAERVVAACSRGGSPSEAGDDAIRHGADLNAVPERRERREARRGHAAWPA